MPQHASAVRTGYIGPCRGVGVPRRLSGLDASDFQGLMAIDETASVRLEDAAAAETKEDKGPLASARTCQDGVIIRKGVIRPVADTGCSVGATPLEEIPDVPTDLRHLSAMSSDDSPFFLDGRSTGEANDFSMGTGEDQFDAILRAGEAACAEA